MDELQVLIDYWTQFYNDTRDYTSLACQRNVLDTIDKLQELKNFKEGE